MKDFWAIVGRLEKCHKHLNSKQKKQIANILLQTFYYKIRKLKIDFQSIQFIYFELDSTYWDIAIKLGR